jgi:tRNA pseudouridine55 synthase
LHKSAAHGPLPQTPTMMNSSGILLVDKAKGSPSFRLVSILRRLTGVRKVGHAGTLDPLATGLMVMLVGKEFTRKSEEFLSSDKEYLATLCIGIETDTYDAEGKVLRQSDTVPSLLEVENALSKFQGTLLQIPPMFSAKKQQGQKLYELARKGISVPRPPVSVHLQIEWLSYEYPMLKVRVRCSKGTYIRSLAHDLGQELGTGAHLAALCRTKSGSFRLEDATAEGSLSLPLQFITL